MSIKKSDKQFINMWKQSNVLVTWTRLRICDHGDNSPAWRNIPRVLANSWLLPYSLSNSPTFRKAISLMRKTEKNKRKNIRRYNNNGPVLQDWSQSRQKILYRRSHPCHSDHINNSLQGTEDAAQYFRVLFAKVLVQHDSKMTHQLLLRNRQSGWRNANVNGLRQSHP